MFRAFLFLQTPLAYSFLWFLLYESNSIDITIVFEYTEALCNPLSWLMVEIWGTLGFSKSKAHIFVSFDTILIYAGIINVIA